MFRARRRPLLRGAMVGGAAYAAGKRHERSGYREDDQEQRLEALESNQPAPAAPAPPAASGAGPSTDMVGRLKELAALKDSGVLTAEEFDTAKAKVLAG